MAKNSIRFSINKNFLKATNHFQGLFKDHLHFQGLSRAWICSF